MKTNIKRVAASLIIAAFVAVNAFAGGECGFSGQRDKGSKAKGAITRELNLSKEQQDRLAQEKASHREAMQALRSALKEKKSALQEAIAKPDVTRQQIEPIMSEIKKLQSDMADKRVDGIFAVKSVLTPEQFAKLQSVKDKRMRSGSKKHGQKERK